ncbi:M15 family metallopeptidase [Candidatus Parcubacteria bacterium]|nr:M15 family metallopeptidase [Candidatus Parcubacteria bacterium]
MSKVSPETVRNLLIGLIVVLSASAATLGYFLYTTTQTLETTLATTSARITELEGTLLDTQERLAIATSTNNELENNLVAEKDRNDGFADQIDKITGTVQVLDKLSKTDKELLQKYSKVYFLNEHYVPDSLSSIDKEWLYNEAIKKQIHTKVNPFLEDMLQAALDDGVKIWIVSAYRSWDEQANLKGSYSITYGSGANTFSADQGYSEHQLGTTLDFTTEGIGGGLDGFGNTKAYQWLLNNAYKYGFVLSYPENNGYYIFEPWHWRFVGEDLAKYLDKNDFNFYDVEQRKIDEYLVSIFD